MLKQSLVTEPQALGTNERSVPLPTGTLRVRVDRTELPLDAICGFAARRNPKRGFLFVSKVLGKHIPVRPSLMRDIYSRLAQRLTQLNAPGPVAVIGMAETAIALGHGVHDEYVRQTRRDDVIFLHSTRYKVNSPVAIEFLEEHSHAADHIIYEPADARHAAMLQHARTLFLVDDEASTGKTFVNLVSNMRRIMPRLERVVTVVITDWRGPARLAGTHAQIPLPCESVAILEGEYQFEAAPNLVAVEMPKVTGNGGLKDALIRSNFGRLALQGPLSLHDCAHSELPVDLGGRILVLGTGEFAYPPFLLAEQLERDGLQVFYQSTTRSPIMTGLSIETALTFTDNYGDDIPNFVYNAQRQPYDRVLVCHETPRGTVDHQLLAALRAESVEFAR
jgi:hypothetical protein